MEAWSRTRLELYYPAPDGDSRSTVITKNPGEKIFRACESFERSFSSAPGGPPAASGLCITYVCIHFFRCSSTKKRKAATAFPWLARPSTSSSSTSSSGLLVSHFVHCYYCIHRYRRRRH